MTTENRQTKPHYLRWVECLTVLFTISLMPTVSTSAATPKSGPESESPEATISEFLDQFSAVHSVRLEARALIHLESPAGSRTGQGSFSYQEQDGRFRVRCETDRSLGLMDDVEYAYDGQLSLIWFLGSNTVTSNESFLEQAPTALPNPFFLPLDFLVGQEDCTHCRLSLDRVLRAREATASSYRQVGDRLSVGGTDLEPSHTVDLVKAAKIWVPERITRTMPDRSGEVVLTMRDYKESRGFVFPRAITVETIDSEQQAAMRMDLLITQIAVNQPIEADVFSSLGNESSTFIFSGDRTKDIPAP